MGEEASAGSKGLTRGQQEWLTHLKECEAQGCSSVVYARKRGLSVTALYAARKDLTQRGVFRTGRASRPVTTVGSSSPVTLVPVQVCSPPPASVCVLRVVLPNAEPRTSANNYRDSGAGCWASRTSRSSVPG